MTRIGMIVPPSAGHVPPEPPELYPDLDFIAEGMALPRLTPEGYDSVIDRAAELASRLKERGAEAVSMMGTSLSFYRGPEGNAEVLAAMGGATGLPVTTMTDSVLEALAAFGARTVAVATAYTDAVNQPLKDYLAASDFQVAGLEALHLTGVAEIQATTEEQLLDLGARAIAAAPGAEALLISCGGLKTINVCPALEDRFGLPVISSATAGAWGAVRLTGHTGRSAGHGRLFELG